MKPAFVVLIGAALLASASSLVAQQGDWADCKDSPLFPTRMPEYRIADCKVEDYGRYEFYAQKGAKIPIEGKFTFITYAFTGARGTEPSGLAVVRNYEAAIQKIGGTTVGIVPTWWVNGKLVKNGQETWMQVEKGNGKIWLRIVEKKAMEQFIIADATALGNDLKATGHASVYGILFDTGKSEIKPESAKALEAVAGLLKGDPALKLHIVGHTDNVGEVQSNVRLSQARGEAVLQALVKDYGIAVNRLDAYGCGQYAPVATNETEEGRAKNRRVELVRQ